MVKGNERVRLKMRNARRGRMDGDKLGDKVSSRVFAPERAGF